MPLLPFLLPRSLSCSGAEPGAGWPPTARAPSAASLPLPRGFDSTAWVQILLQPLTPSVAASLCLRVPICEIGTVTKAVSYDRCDSLMRMYVKGW